MGVIYPRKVTIVEVLAFNSHKPGVANVSPLCKLVHVSNTIQTIINIVTTKSFYINQINLYGSIVEGF